jgi:hypothetical protein
MRHKLWEHVRTNAVAYVALFVALGGTGAWAATTIKSKNIAKDAVLSRHIKNGEVRGPDVRANSLTGVHVNEGTLGKVPSAASADSAAHANSADGATNATSAGSATTAQTAATANSVAANAIDSAAVSDNSLTGTDINEGSLVGVGGVLMGRVRSVPPGAPNEYGAPSGESTANASFGNVQIVSPPVPLTLRNLRASSSTAPGTGTSIVVTVTADGLSTPLTCTIPVGDTVCKDTEHTAVTAGGEKLSIKIDNTSGSSQDVTFGFSVQG